MGNGNSKRRQLTDCHLPEIEERQKDLLQRAKTARADHESALTFRAAPSDLISAGGLSIRDSESKKYLALIAHNHLKPAMRDFVIRHKDVLKHFQITGTNSTMTMVGDIFENEKGIEYGPTLSSGPLGGDAQVAALLTQGELGGMIFFADPLYSHPHIADVNSLIRLANVHNILYACNPTTGDAIMQILRLGLKDKALIPSFYEHLESPSVAEYRKEQQTLLHSLKQEQMVLAKTLKTMRDVPEEELREFVKTLREKSLSDLFAEYDIDDDNFEEKSEENKNKELSLGGGVMKDNE